ncbi:tetraspanin [Epithele typhae]|uniref:tetraspanin n=1 Tax=Epithele typhae TaxID=378194 RepID=UPI002008638D|nr:tetraspanin [Epithele typhae]KAH9946337.1 tetraspanin [Epithele typhae]
MPSKGTMTFWGLLDVSLLAAGAIMVAFSQIFAQPNLLINFALSKSQLFSGLIGGIFLLVTWIVSICGIVQKNHVTFGLVVLNWFLLIDAIVILVIGTALWIFSLQERTNYLVLFNAATPATRIALQDHYKCCGWFTPNDTVEIGGFCANLTFANSLVDPNNTETGRCVGPVTKDADYTLNNVFTTIYGFMAVVIGLFLATMCVIKQREEEERFKKIDAKRGGRGFV